MSAHEAGTWWAIERLHTDGPYERQWVLQWEPTQPCWPRLFTRRREVREYLRDKGDTSEWMRKHWRQRAVKVRVVQA